MCYKFSFKQRAFRGTQVVQTCMVGFFGPCSQHLDRNWTPKPNLPAHSLKQLSFSDRDNKNEESPVHCKWICYVQTDPCFSSLSFHHGKPVVGKNSVVLLLPACRSEAWAGNWYGRYRASTQNAIKIQWKVVEIQSTWKKSPACII